ncbi:hypothetical protein [Entomobacter blattae]|uniref:Uncharacterized protein n=1 Tax=Entomobacter blattae TaxID=2762277 RepID=A0A7H1NTC9_9PROT|nr:hypothetical protein [Entomobacter blattae]QNT79039.1 hypothetical protein JGUZn3_18250 [Entomobacter blattae]
MENYIIKDDKDQVLAKADSVTDAVMKCVAIKYTNIITAVFCINYNTKTVVLSAVDKDGNRKNLFSVNMKKLADKKNMTEDEIIEQSLRMFNDFNKKGWNGSIGYLFNCKIV